MKRKRAALVRNILLLLLCVLLLVSTARADFGPKPSLTIKVINAPEGELYLDLLVEGEPSESSYFAQYKEAEYDSAILAQLRTLEGDGWVLAYSTGLAHSNSPAGDLRPQRNGTWRFGYWIPDSFRIAAATADQAQAVRTPYEFRSLSNSLVYDWETNTLRDAVPAPVRFAGQVLITLIPTLLVEGYMLFRFGFREKRTWLVFAVMNVITQIGLHIFCGDLLLFSGMHIVIYLILMLIPELVIWAVETAAFALLFREQSVKRRVGYALCANAVSFLAGYVPVFLWLIVQVLH